MAKKVQKAEPPSKSRKAEDIDPKKLEAQNAARRARRAKQKEEAAEQLKLEHFVEIAATGAMVSDPSAKPPKQMKAARDAVWEAFTRIGGVDALTVFAQKYPKEFFTQIFAKLIPRAAELDVSDSLEELLSQMGGGQIPGMHENGVIDGDFTEIPQIEITSETMQ